MTVRLLEKGIPDDAASLWSLHERRLRRRDDRLWLPRDLDRRVAWTIEDSRADPEICGATAQVGGKTVGLAMVIRQRLDPLSPARAICPERSVDITSLAVHPEFSTVEVVPALITAVTDSPMLRDLPDMYASTAAACATVRDGLEASGFIPWMVEARRSANPVDWTLPSDIVVRPSDFCDVAPAIELWIEMVLFHYSADARCARGGDLEAIGESMVAQAAQSANQAIFVAVLESRTVGMIHVAVSDSASSDYLTAKPPGRHGFVLSIAVTESARGRGVGKALFHTGNRWMLSQGAECVFLHYNSGNPLSPGFWAGCGFRPFIVTYHRYRG